jgi:protein-S-isoprenylcysteine O-methyltransferase Ste14
MRQSYGEQRAMTQPLPILIGCTLWLVFVIAWAIAGGRAAPDIATAGPRRERAYSLIVALGLVMMVLSPPLLIRHAFQLWSNPPVLAWILLLAMSAGIALCCWARIHLGRLWSAHVTRKEGHRVVDSGPYRKVRHPVYSGLMLMYFGFALLCGSALALAAAVVISLGLWLKARLEEKFLAAELGTAAYDLYRARTPMFVPRLRPPV